MNKDYAEYFVTFKCDCRYTVPVKASSLDEAKQLAQSEFESANFGTMEFVDSDIIMIEDANGDYVYEK